MLKRTRSSEDVSSVPSKKTKFKEKSLASSGAVDFAFKSNRPESAISSSDVQAILNQHLKRSYSDLSKNGSVNILLVEEKLDVLKCLVKDYGSEISFNFIKEACSTFIVEGKIEQLCVILDTFNVRSKTEVLLLSLFEIPYENNESLYEYVSQNPKCVHDLACGLAKLVEAGIPYLGNEKLYEMLVDSLFPHILAFGFKTLIKSDIPYSGNESLYLLLTSHSGYADKFASIFKVLVDAGMPFSKNKPLYQELIECSPNADKLALGFKTLVEAGIPLLSNNSHYKALIKHSSNADKLALGFKTLVEAGIPLSSKNLHYKALIKHSSNADKLALGFKTLIEADIQFSSKNSHYKKLSKLLITHSFNADKLALGFKILAEAGITLSPGNKLLYKAMINASGYADKLALGFKTLAKAGVPFPDNKQLYQTLINKSSYIDKLALGFKTLVEAGIPLSSDTLHYQALIKRPFEADTLALVFIGLAKSGVPYQSDEKLCKSIEKNPSILTTKQTLNLLHYFGIHFSVHPGFFNINLLVTHVKWSSHILSELKEVGCTLSAHGEIFNLLLTQLSAEHLGLQNLLGMIKRLSNYTKINKLPSSSDADYKYQLKKLTDILKQEGELMMGPLRKSEATVEIEKLLGEIARGVNHASISYNAQEHYILHLRDKNINISLLLKSANLSQLSLDEDIIKNLGLFLGRLTIFSAERVIDKIVKVLPEVQQIAISIYLSERYTNINRLFRSEAFDISPEYVFNVAEPGKDRLICFILGCLLNDAANKVGSLAEAAGFEPSSVALFDRGERLSDEVIQGRLANPWVLPALTSFSASQEGSPYFNKPGTMRTKLEHPPRLHIINEHENEALLSHGEQVVTAQGPGCLISKIVRSPDLVVGNHYKSDLALAHVFKHYLSKEYKYEKSRIKIDKIDVYRPNHNQTHVYRVMLGIELVLNYFSNHAKDKEFKAFCQELSPKNIEWLRIAAAFSITGRESEISAGQDLETYDSYREASRKHFSDFVNSEMSDIGGSMKERMENIIRYMGNPHYEKGLEGKAAINDHPDEKEREIRNYYHRILTIAHKLDLPRCYSSKKYGDAMQLCKNLSLNSHAQNYAYTNMVRYVIGLIKAHGGRLSCDIDPSGELKDVCTDYQETYATSSTSMHFLFRRTQTVERPPKSRIKP